MMKLFVLLVGSLLFASAVGQLPSQDILALLEFKKGIEHDPTGFVLDSWNEESIDFNGCPSSWNGIVCNGGNVAGVVLDHLGLSANVDLSVFSNLTMLVKLSMSNNSITGKFPQNIGDFKSLEYLDISDNLFFSSLPPEIGSVSSLQNLSLAGNNFSESVPDSISGLSSIQSLDLSRNSFSGPLPSSFSKLANLVSLNLSLNRFTKQIPKLHFSHLFPSLVSSHLNSTTNYQVPLNLIQQQSREMGRKKGVLFDEGAPDDFDPENPYKDPVAMLEMREHIVREKWIDIETAKILREKLRWCYRIEGVNHLQKCRHLVQQYLDSTRGIGWGKDGRHPDQHGPKKVEVE